MVRCLKKQIPEAEIHFLTKATFASIPEANPNITKVWHWTDRGASAVLAELKKQRFDFVADLHHNLRSLRVKLALRRPGASFNKLNFEKFLLVNFKINRLPKKHIVDRYLDTVSSLGIVNDGEGLDFFIPPQAEDFDIKQLPAGHQAGYVALVAGALQGTKRMPREKLSELCSILKKPVVVLGGEAEKPIGSFLAQGHSHVVDLCGKLSLAQSAMLIKQASAVVTHDTGLMHIASAFRKPIISIWGNTIPEFGMSPYLPFREAQSFIHEVKNLSCRPCSKIGFSSCPKKHFNCMNNQDIKKIISDLELAFKDVKKSV